MKPVFVFFAYKNLAVKKDFFGILMGLNKFYYLHICLLFILKFRIPDEIIISKDISRFPLCACVCVSFEILQKQKFPQ